MALFFGELKEVGFRQNLPLKPLNLLAFSFGAIADMVGHVTVSQLPDKCFNFQPLI